MVHNDLAVSKLLWVCMQGTCRAPEVHGQKPKNMAAPTIGKVLADYY